MNRSLPRGSWQVVATPWMGNYKLKRLEFINGLFYALHPFEGLFFSSDGLNWTRMGRGLPQNDTIYYYDFDIFKNRSNTNQYGVFLATASGVYRAKAIHGNSEFSRASNGLPPPPNHHVSFIAGTDFKIDDFFEHYLICGAVIRHAVNKPLYISSYGGDSWVPACEGYPMTEEAPVDMVLNKYAYIITLSGKIYTCADAHFINWAIIPELSGVTCFGMSGSWGFVATANNEFWKVHFEDSRWQMISSNMDRPCVAFSRSQQAALVACFHTRGIRRSISWPSVPEWDDSFNDGFPRYENGLYQNAYLLATTDQNEIMLAAVHNERDSRNMLYRFV